MQLKLNKELTKQKIAIDLKSIIAKLDTYAESTN